MTVMELHNELVKLILHGHADTRVIANINFKSQWDLKKGEEVGDFHLLYLNDVYYQSGDIELGFSFDKEETEND
jgi:hypothetical protein